MSKKASPTSIRFSKAVMEDLSTAKRLTRIPRTTLIEMSVERGLPVLLRALGLPPKGGTGTKVQSEETSFPSCADLKQL